MIYTYVRYKDLKMRVARHQTRKDAEATCVRLYADRFPEQEVVLLDGHTYLYDGCTFRKEWGTIKDMAEEAELGRS